MENLTGITIQKMHNNQTVCFYRCYWNSKIAARAILAENRLDCFYQNIILIEVNKNMNLSRCVYEINDVICEETMKNIVIGNFIGFEPSYYKNDLDYCRLHKILYSKKITETEKKLAEKKGVSLFGIKGLIFNRIFRYQLHLLLRTKENTRGISPYGRELRQCLETIHEQLQNL